VDSILVAADSRFKMTLPDAYVLSSILHVHSWRQIKTLGVIAPRCLGDALNLLQFAKTT